MIDLLIHPFIVTYINPEAQITILKVPRDNYKIIQAACTLLTKNSITDEPIVASILSIHGSARTCKIATIKFLRKWFNDESECIALNKNINDSNNGDRVKSLDSLLKKLHNQMEEISA